MEVMCVLSEWKVKGWNPEEHLGISGGPGGVSHSRRGKNVPQKNRKKTVCDPIELWGCQWNQVVYQDAGCNVSYNNTITA